jgi:plastocyanin
MTHDDPEPVATHEITIPGPWVFEPEVAQVTAGEQVTWTNEGGAAHTVTIKGLGVDVTLDPGEEFSFTFEEPGTYGYECRLHPPGMKGSIIVLPATGGTATSSASRTNSTGA